MKRAWLVLVLASCSASGGDDGYPIGNGGMPPINNDGSGGTKDGGVGDGDGGVTDGGVPLKGRVCLLNDLRKLGDATACEKTGVGDLTVSFGMGLPTSAGTRTTKTAADGSFSLVAPVGAGYVWHVAPGKGTVPIIASMMQYGTDNTIPVYRDAAFRDLAAGNGSALATNDASLVMRVVRGTKGVTQLVATTVGNNQPVLYDSGANGNAQVWDNDATDSFGIAWIPAYTVDPNPSATTTVGLKVDGTATVVMQPRSFPLEPATVTFATIELPPTQ